MELTLAQRYHNVTTILTRKKIKFRGSEDMRRITILDGTSAHSTVHLSDGQVQFTRNMMGALAKTLGQAGNWGIL